MPAFGLIGIRMVSIEIRLEKSMRVIVHVAVKVRLLLEINCSWGADFVD
jgi:hypothetical protein